MRSCVEQIKLREVEVIKPIVESIRDYILTCDFLKEGRVNVDYLPVEMSYSIDPIGGDPWYKKYVGGGGLKQFPFALTSNEMYDGDERTGINNSGFYQFFEEWIEENNLTDILPELDGHDAVRMDVLQSGYLFSTEANYGRYQIQCRLIYTA